MTRILWKRATRSLIALLALATMVNASAAVRFTTPVAGGNDLGGDVCVDGASVYVAGSLDGGLANRTDIYLARYAAPGILLWRNRLPIGLGTVDRALRVIAGGGFVYVVGTVDFRAGADEDIFVACYTAAGAFVAGNIFNGTGNNADVPVDVQFDAGGNLCVLGTTESAGTQSDIVMTRFAPGLAGFVRRFWDGGMGLNDVAAQMVLYGPLLHIIGTSVSPAGNTDYTYLTYDPAVDAFTLRRTVDFGMNDKGVDISVDAFGVYLGGTSETPANGLDVGVFWTNGVTNSQQLYRAVAGPFDDVCTGLESANWNWIWVSATSQVPGRGTDYWVFTPTATLAGIQWMNFYNGPVNGDDRSIELIVDPAVGVFLTGRSQGPGSGDDYATVMFDPTTGGIGWVNRYDWNNLDETPTNMTLGGSGLFVTGNSLGAVTGVDIATQRINPATGANLW